MSTQTTNNSFVLPELNETADITVINNAITAIDTKLGAVGNTSLKGQVDSINTRIGDFEQIINTSSITAIADIPVNFVGRLKLSASESPTGAEGNFCVLSFGGSKTYRLIVVPDGGDVYYSQQSGSSTIVWRTLYSSGKQFVGRETLTAGTDLNDVTAPGVYYLSGAGNYTNMPPNNITYSILEVFRPSPDSTTCMQRLTVVNSASAVYIRNRRSAGNGWGDWRKIYTQTVGLNSTTINSSSSPVTFYLNGGTRTVMRFIGPNAGLMGEYFLATTTAGTLTVKIIGDEAYNISYTTARDDTHSMGVMTVTSASSTTATILCETFAGRISTEAPVD